MSKSNLFREAHFEGLRVVVDREQVPADEVDKIAADRFDHDPEVAILEEDELQDGRKIISLRRGDRTMIARYTEQPPSL